jgi:hypothetical protein
VYVDHDPVVLVHARALLQAGGVAVLSADLTDPPAVLWHLEASGAADLGQPCALVLGAVLGCVRAERAGEIVRCYAGALAPGSAVVISLIRVSDPVASARVAGLFPGWQGHGEEQVQAWFDGAGLRIPQKTVSHVGAEWPMVPLSCECRVAGIGAVGIKDPDMPLPRRRRNGSSLSGQRGKT